MTSPRGAPSRQELADNPGEGETIWDTSMTVVSVAADSPHYTNRLRRYQVDLHGGAAAEVTVTGHFPEPPRVGQRMRVALFDLEGGE